MDVEDALELGQLLGPPCRRPATAIPGLPTVSAVDYVIIEQFQLSLVIV